MKKQTFDSNVKYQYTGTSSYGVLTKM